MASCWRDWNLKTVSTPPSGRPRQAAIRPRLTGDDYAVLGDGDAHKGYTLRLYHKPLVSWIWAGAGLMALGGLLAAIGRARRPHHGTELDIPT